MTIDDIQDKVNTAKLYYVQQVALKLAKIRVGSQVSFKTLLGVKRLITGLTFQITADVIDSDTNTMYNCLLKALGGFGAPYNVDPEVQIPGTTIITVPIGSIVTSEPIVFTNQSTVSLSDYQSTYASTFGQFPVVQIYVSDGAGGFNLDNGTSPTFAYVTPNNPTSGLVSVTWGFAVPTSGYILILGYIQ